MADKIKVRGRDVGKSVDETVFKVKGIKGDRGERGLTGPKGKDGADGRDGYDGVDGTNGRDGLNGTSGLDGKAGLDGRNGLNGKDGASVKAAAIKDDGNLHIDLTDGRTINAGRARGEDGKKGKVSGGAMQRLFFDPDTNKLSIEMGNEVTLPAGGGVTVQDEGVDVVAPASAMNFTGAGVTVSDVAGVATVTIPGGGGGGPTVITNTQTGDQDDWTPTGIGADTFINWSGATPMMVKGFDSATAKRITFVNTSGTLAIIQNQASSSTAANRIALDIGLQGHSVIPPGESVVFVHDGSRWRPVSRSGGPRAQSPQIQMFPSTGSTIGATGGAPSSNGGTISNTTTGNPPTNYASSAARLIGATGTGAGTQTGARILMPFGANAFANGFLARFEWSHDYPASAASWFVGVFGSTGGIGNNDLTVPNNLWGWGADPTSAAEVHTVGGVAPVLATLGSNFPENNTAVYEGFIYFDPGLASATRVLWRLDDNTISPAYDYATGAALPSPGGYSPIFHLCNRAAAVNYRIFIRWMDGWKN